MKAIMTQSQMSHSIEIVWDMGDAGPREHILWLKV